jgi:arginase
MDVRLIQVPYMAGDDQHGSSQGPARLIAAGADRVLKAAGVAVTIAKVGRNGPFRDTASSTARINKQLGIVIRDTISIGQLPIVLSGSCVSAHGVLAGLGDRRHGAVWIDAHADFNTPDTTITGFFPGMSAAIAVGHCYPGYRAFVGLTRPLDAADIVMLGVRDLWPAAERERLHRSAIHVVPWSNGARQGDVTASPSNSSPAASAASISTSTSTPSHRRCSGDRRRACSGGPVSHRCRGDRAVGSSSL